MARLRLPLGVLFWVSGDFLYRGPSLAVSVEDPLEKHIRDFASYCSGFLLLCSALRGWMMRETKRERERERERERDREMEKETEWEADRDIYFIYLYIYIYIYIYIYRERERERERERGGGTETESQRQKEVWERNQPDGEKEWTNNQGHFSPDRQTGNYKSQNVSLR